MTTDTPVSSSPAPASAVAVPLKGLPTEVSEWIFCAQQAPTGVRVSHDQTAASMQPFGRPLKRQGVTSSGLANRAGWAPGKNGMD